MHKILSLNPTAYQRHRIHTQERDWAETNCYVDVWIELLHAMGHEPLAAMPFTLAIDFEGDQWTFFKFPLSDIYSLYGLDVQELAIWKPMLNHVEEQIALGRPVLIELDSFFLPDTAGTAYKIAHVKSTVAVVEIDVKNHHCGYFHGQGYYHVTGEDFIDVFRLRGEPDPSILAPYVEFAKPRWQENLSSEETLAQSLKLLRKQLTLLPTANPFTSFKSRLKKDLEWLMTEDLDMFHQYSFATLRQFGACYELAATYLQWLTENGEQGLDSAKADLSAISETAKAYQFQLARSMTRKKPLETDSLDQMGELWLSAMEQLKQKYSLS